MVQAILSAPSSQESDATPIASIRKWRPLNGVPLDGGGLMRFAPAGLSLESVVVTIATVRLDTERQRQPHRDDEELYH